MAGSDVEDDRSPSTSPEDSSGEQEGGDMAEISDSKGEGLTTNGHKTSNAKDPLRPRRKKARRACYACQRAHLTCGDERPCQRCIKRGLQDACQDGVRKKAKYLHDAPNEALMPGAGGNLFNPMASGRSNSSGQSNESPLQQNSFFRSSQPFATFTPTGQMPPPLLQDRSMSTPIFGQQSPIHQNFNVTSHGSIPTPNIPQGSDSAPAINPGWSGALFDPSDPALFNFDLASMNFGNHYGALEFGMLGHLATGAGEPSPTDTQRGSIGHHNGSNPFSMPLGGFSESPGSHSAFPYNEVMVGDWQKNQNLYSPQFTLKPEPPNAFAIESNVAHFTSPDTESTPPDTVKFEDSPILNSSAVRKPAITSTPVHQEAPGGAFANESSRRAPTYISTPQLKAKSQIPVKSSKRPRDPSSIYINVTSPYPYTLGFHSLIAYLQRRFAASPSKTLTIAKSLASIRPSFIATTKTLNRDDLIFMEKCFQRTLWEYEGFIEGVGTPTIVARRTGEIAAVGREFEFLTGWTKKVLLGRAPNENVNRGGSSGLSSQGPGSGANTGNARTGVNTPIYRTGVGQGQEQTGEGGEKRLQPVFLAELLDDDSVVTFYEDFARLAFGDSRGSVMGKGKLLKYRTKDDEIDANLKKEAERRGDLPSGRPDGQQRRADGATDRERRHAGELKKEGIDGQNGMQKLGAADGKVECTFCWTVKRDVFDIPMLIVMNFLPCI